VDSTDAGLAGGRRIATVGFSDPIDSLWENEYVRDSKTDVRMTYRLQKEMSGMSVSITPKAKAHLINLEVGVGDTFLRLSVEQGGCAGMTYNACIDTEMKEGDEVIHDEDCIRVVADTRSTLYLAGIDIDYSDDLVRSGIRLSNGNNEGSCGCGASFNPDTVTSEGASS